MASANPSASCGGRVVFAVNKDGSHFDTLIPALGRADPGTAAGTKTSPQARGGKVRRMSQEEADDLALDQVRRVHAKTGKLNPVSSTGNRVSWKQRVYYLE